VKVKQPTVDPAVKANINNPALDERVAAEDKAISKSNAWRTQRPKRRPRRTRGHGITHLLLVDIGAKMKDKKDPPHQTPVAVPETELPKFMTDLLMERAECAWLKEQSEGQSIVTRFFSTTSRP
jgi:hypothetical protein